MNASTWIAMAALLLGLAGLGARAGGRRRWDRATRDLLARLQAARQAPEPARFDPRELDGLPAPVQRYFRAALTAGMPIVAAARLHQVGCFNLAADGERWKPFSATQQVVTRQPGFVWDARIAMLPGLPVQVHDAYVGGVGLLRPALLGLVDLGGVHDRAELARGELMRFLAEAAWYPTALLPSQGVRWTAVDADSADATLAYGSTSATLRFRFGSDGLIDSVRAETRGRNVAGRMEPTPWEGRWSDPERRAGMCVPTRGEVAWLLPDGRRPYWRGTVTALEFEFAA